MNNTDSNKKKDGFNSLRMLLISWGAPPGAGGSARIIHNLLKWLGHEEVVLLGGTPIPGAGTLEESTSHRRVLIPSYPTSWRGETYLRWLSLPFIILSGLYLVYKYRLRQIVACYPNDVFLMAGYIIHRLTGLPFSLFFHDLYLENTAGYRHRLAERMEPKYFQDANALFVANPGMAKHYSKIYKTFEPTILSYCINSDIPETVELTEPASPLRIGFSGSIYDNVLDCLGSMRSLVELDDNLRLNLFTPTTPEMMKKLGLEGERIERSFCSTTEQLLQSLRSCDILYLPLCFDCKQILSDEIETAFPIKSLEYLVSGCPILVHCPKNYYLSHFFREYEAALVLNDPSQDALKKAIYELAANRGLREKLVKNALKTAKLFHGPAIAGKMRSVILRIPSDHIKSSITERESATTGATV